jgi:hypothetical protein
MAHVQALTKWDAEYQRFFTTAGLWCHADLILILNRHFPGLNKKLPQGGTKGNLPKDIFQVNNEVT